MCQRNCIVNKLVDHVGLQSRGSDPGEAFFNEGESVGVFAKLREVLGDGGVNACKEWVLGSHLDELDQDVCGVLVEGEIERAFFLDQPSDLQLKLVSLQVLD